MRTKQLTLPLLNNNNSLKQHKKNLWQTIRETSNKLKDTTSVLNFDKSKEDVQKFMEILDRKENRTIHFILSNEHFIIETYNWMISYIEIYKTIWFLYNFRQKKWKIVYKVYLPWEDLSFWYKLKANFLIWLKKQKKIFYINKK